MSLAKEQINSQRNTRAFLYGFIVVFVVAASVVALIFWYGKMPVIIEREPEIILSGQDFHMTTGIVFDYSILGKHRYLTKEGATKTNRGDAVLVMTSRDGFAKWLKFYRAGDQYGIDELKKNGEAISITPQTKCLILNVVFAGDGTEYEVRILEGKHANKVFYASMHYLCKTE